MVVLHRNLRKSMAKNGNAATFPAYGRIARMLLFSFILMLLYQFIVLHDFTSKSQSKIPLWYGPHSRYVPNCPNFTVSDTTSKNEDDICTKEFERITSDLSDIRVPGLTLDDFERSIAHVGNRYRLAQFTNKLIQSSSKSLIGINQSPKGGSPVSVVVCGGSISLGHGVTPNTARYSDQLEVWLNVAFPVSTNNSLKHQVFNRGSHGADVCYE
jgi:hypothetical protein